MGGGACFSLWEDSVIMYLRAARVGFLFIIIYLVSLSKEVSYQPNGGYSWRFMVQ